MGDIVHHNHLHRTERQHRQLLGWSRRRRLFIINARLGVWSSLARNLCTSALLLFSIQISRCDSFPLSSLARNAQHICICQVLDDPGTRYLCVKSIKDTVSVIEKSPGFIKRHDDARSGRLLEGWQLSGRICFNKKQKNLVLVSKVICCES